MVSFRPLEIPADLMHFLDLFMLPGSVYVPELIGDRETYRHGDIAQLERNWIQEGSLGGLLFKRERPIVVNTVLTVTKEDLRRRAPHHIFMSIDGAYFDSMKRLAELVDLGTSAYDFLLPCYGFIELPWMPRLKAETMPDRGLPGWGWATWLGAEYTNIITLPPLSDASVTPMSDGGRLILLPYPASLSSPDQNCLKAYKEIRYFVDRRAFQTQAGESDDSQPTHLGSDIRTSSDTNKGVALKDVLIPKFRFRD